MVGHTATLTNHLQNKTLRAHTLAPSNLPLLKAPTESLFWNLQEFGSHIRFDVFLGY
jgi:hypothetical protein